MQHRSISQRLTRAKSTEAKQAVIDAWAKSWETEQTQLIAEIGQAIAKDDFNAMCIALGQLKTVSAKKFTSLPKVLSALLKGQSSDN